MANWLKETGFPHRIHYRGNERETCALLHITTHSHITTHYYTFTYYYTVGFILFDNYIRGWVGEIPMMIGHWKIFFETESARHGNRHTGGQKKDR